MIYTTVFFVCLFVFSNPKLCKNSNTVKYYYTSLNSFIFEYIFSKVMYSCDGKAVFIITPVAAQETILYYQCWKPLRLIFLWKLWNS